MIAAKDDLLAAKDRELLQAKGYMTSRGVLEHILTNVFKERCPKGVDQSSGPVKVLFVWSFCPCKNLLFKYNNKII